MGGGDGGAGEGLGGGAHLTASTAPSGGHTVREAGGWR